MIFSAFHPTRRLIIPDMKPQIEKGWAADIKQEFFEDESWRDFGDPICAGEPQVR